MCHTVVDYTAAPVSTDIITGREGAETVIIHGLVEGDRHMVVDDGIITEAVLVMDRGVPTEVAAVKIMVHGYLMAVVEDPMGIKGDIMEVEDLVVVVVVLDSMGIMEVGVVVGIHLVVHHQVGKTQEEGEEVGTGVGHLSVGMGRKKSASTVMVLLRRLVTKKVSSHEIYFIVINHYFYPHRSNLESVYVTL
jgi:hypothetical protein